MSRFNVLVTANAFKESAPAVESSIVAAGGQVLYPPRMGPLPEADLIPWLERADAVIAATDPYVGAVLDACPRLRAVVRWGTGYDTVDVGACTQRGVAACNTPGLNLESVAEHVLTVLLALARNLPRQVEVMRTGGWAEVRGTEVWKKTVGIIGFGGIGRAVARRLVGFDCRILAYDPHVAPETIRALGAEPVSLEKLFEESDFISLHATLMPETRGMVGMELFRKMKSTAYFINAARGPLVDEDALARVLREGQIAGAAVDTFTHEPLPVDHPLRSLPNCLLTPHSAFNTIEAAAATNHAVAEEVLAVLRGVRPKYCLNPAVLDLPHYRGRVPLIPD